MPNNQQPESATQPYERPKWVTPAIWALGLMAAFAVGSSRDGLGPSYLDQAGKLLFWASGVFIPFVAVHTKETATSSGKRALFLLLLLHLFVNLFAYKYLTNWSFVTLALICLAGLALLNPLFARVQKSLVRV